MDQTPSRPKSRKPVVFRDGLGRRARTLDSSGAELEVLCLRSELTAAESFEPALRDRVARLANFRGGSFARVRNIQRLNDAAATLVLVSAATPGIRLSDLLASAERHGVPFDSSAGWSLMRQLVSAIALLHEHAPDVAHGAIAPERIVITPDARLVVVEHVLGGALETAGLSQARYWQECRVGTLGEGVLDLRADVLQIGLVALSLVLGRPLRDEDHPSRLREIVEAAALTSIAGGAEPMPGSLRGWLDRTLQLDPRRSFGSAIEASAELHRVLEEGESLVVPLAIEAFLARLQSQTDPPKAIVNEAPLAGLEAPASSGDLARPASAPEPDSASTASTTETVAAEAAPSGMAPATWNEPVNHRPASVLSLFGDTDARPAEVTSNPAFKDVQADLGSPGTRRRLEIAWKERAWSRQAVAAAVLTILCTMGWAAASRMSNVKAQPADAQRADTASLAVDESTASASPAGDPVPAALPAATPVVPDGKPASAPIVGAAAPPVAISAPAPAPGWVTINAPQDLQVFQNGVVVGNSRGGRIALAPGTHQLDLVNEAIGYRGTHTVQVRSGANAAVSVEFPNGTLALNAMPWAEVFVDGRNVGETPIGNLSVSVGSHEVVFRHPELGEQRMVTTVTLAAPSRLSADLRKQ